MNRTSARSAHPMLSACRMIEVLQANETGTWGRWCAMVRFATLLLAVTQATSTTVAWAGQVTLVSVPAGTQPIRALTDAAGTVHVAADSSSGPQYYQSTDGGRTFSRAVELVSDDARRGGLEFTVWDLAVAADGRVHVALGNNAWKLKLPRDQWGFFYTRRDPATGQFAPVTNINHRPSEGFSLAVDSHGRVAACWLADKLFVNLSTNHGETFAATRELDERLNPCNCCTTSCVFGADGRLAVLYREETNNDRDMYVALWDGQAERAERQRVGVSSWKIDACPMTYYSIVRQGDDYVAAWPTRKSIFFSRLSRDGTALEPREMRTPGTTGIRTGVLVLANPAGEILIAWNDGKQIGWQKYDADHRASGAPGQAQGAGKGVAGVVTRSGDFLLFH